MFEHLDDTRLLPPPTADEVAAVLGGGERLRRRTRRLQILAVAVPTALVVAAVAVLVTTSPFSRQSQPAPITSVSPTPTPTRAPDDGSVAPRGPFEALVVRGTQLVAIDGTGRERAVRDLASLGLVAGALEYAYISNAGVLSIERGGGGHEFLDLVAPSPRLVLAQGIFDGRTWSPDGTRLLSMRTGGVVVVIDPATGRQTEVDLHGGHLPGGGPSLIWSTDGRGVLVQLPDPGGPLAIAPVDGGPLRREVPSLWERGGRTTADGGYVLQKETCGGAAEQCPPTAVRLGNPDGSTTLLYSGQVARTRLADALLGSDGRSAYVLLVAPQPNTVLIARSDASLTPTVLATVPVATTTQVGMGLAPDDSAALVNVVVDERAESFAMEQYVVPLDGNPWVRAGGVVAGWVPTDVVDAIISADS